MFEIITAVAVFPIELTEIVLNTNPGTGPGVRLAKSSARHLSLLDFEYVLCVVKLSPLLFSVHLLLFKSIFSSKN